MVTQSRTYRTIRRKLYKNSRFTKSTDSDYQVRENNNRKIRVFKTASAYQKFWDRKYFRKISHMKIYENTIA